jgi:hypothetical protein
MEKKLHRKLKKGEIVHHIDENKRNNNSKNLEVTDISSHSKHHYYQKDQEWKDSFKLNGINNRPPIYKGSKHPNSKLNENKVKIIKQRLLNKERQTTIARDFGVDRTIIRDIKNGSIWKHVT